MSSPKEEADRLLRDITVNWRLLEQCRDRAAAQIRAVNARYSPQIETLASIIAACEKELVRLVKKHRKAILGGTDRADLVNGSVMLKTDLRVKQIKGMLKKLKDAGLNGAIKVAREVVDWDQVEKFDDATLERLGTRRVKKDLFAYELKQPGDTEENSATATDEDHGNG